MAPQAAAVSVKGGAAAAASKLPDDQAYEVHGCSDCDHSALCLFSHPSHSFQQAAAVSVESGSAAAAQRLPEVAGGVARETAAVRDELIPRVSEEGGLVFMPVCLGDPGRGLQLLEGAEGGGGGQQASAVRDGLHSRASGKRGW